MERFNEKILVAGTFSKDLESAERMREVLKKFSPDVIVGETNQALELMASTRELVWAVLFDECEVPDDLQKKWKAIQTHKEHLVAQNYATSKRVPYFMIDADRELSKAEIAEYAEEYIVDYMKEELITEEIMNYLRETVEEEFYDLEKEQKWTPACKRFYREDFLCKDGRPDFAERKAMALSGEFKNIIERYPDSKIFGFFDGTQIVKPTSVWATRALGRPMQNLRHYIGESGVQYGMLVDLI